MSNFTRENLRHINNLARELEESNFAIFAGAGFSASVGFVNWKQLLEPIAEELDLDINVESDLVSLAQYHCNENAANRGKLNNLIIRHFSKTPEPTKNHKILANLPISTYWTTNYDKLIEDSLTRAGKIVDVKFTNKQLTHTKPKRDAIVYKMHGDVDHPSDTVLTKDDYESYHVKMQPFLNALTGDLTTKTFLFVGFSFTDPNLDYILSRVRISYSSDQRQHYCIQKRIAQQHGESLEEFEYKTRKQKFFTQDLLRFGIKTIFITDYPEITNILLYLEKAYRRKTIFISGAAHEYGKFEKSNAEIFIYNLSKKISKMGFRIVSGFGLGVGSSVITGVLDSIYMSGGRLDNDQLILRPFPQSEVGERLLQDVWHDYRVEMISRAGIAIFVFGNKITHANELVNSDGMIKEFQIAIDSGLFILPIGVTGYASKEIYNTCTEKGYFDKIPDFIRVKLDKLNLTDVTLEATEEIVIEILKDIEKIS